MDVLNCGFCLCNSSKLVCNRWTFKAKRQATSPDPLVTKKSFIYTLLWAYQVPSKKIQLYVCAPWSLHGNSQNNKYPSQCWPVFAILSVRKAISEGKPPLLGSGGYQKVSVSAQIAWWEFLFSREIGILKSLMHSWGLLSYQVVHSWQRESLVYCMYGSIDCQQKLLAYKLCQDIEVEPFGRERWTLE